MIRVTSTLGNITQVINGNNQHITGSISQEAGAIWSFSFEIFPNNIGFDLIKSRKTRIKAVNTITGRVEFAGRVLLSDHKMSGSGLISKSVTCESYLGYLYDSIQPYKAEELYTLEDFIDLVLSNHNAQVEPEKQIFRGTVDVEVADTGNIYKGLQYGTTFETLKSKLVDVYGGEMEIEEIDGVLYLNYIKEIGVTRTTKIKLGRNMQEASRQVNPINIATRIIPLGAKLKVEVSDAEGNVSEQETEERLTLVGYTPPDGEEMAVPYLDDEEKIAELGIVVGKLDFPDVTDQSNLYRKTVEFLTNENRLELSHTLTALDLKEIGQDIDSLNCCDSYPVENELIGLNEVLRITKKTIDINAPYKGSITIGEKQTTFSKLQSSSKDKINIQLQEMAGIVNSLENIQNVVINQVTTLSTNLSQTISGIVAEALATYVTETTLNEVQEDIRTAIELSANGLTTEFEKSITETTEEINGSISSKFTELNSYIRYYMTDEGKPVIELGSSNSDIILKIYNDRISFTQNGIEVAYISDNQLYITNATILNELRIGNMALKRRKNNNLSLVMIGG